MNGRRSELLEASIQRTLLARDAGDVKALGAWVLKSMFYAKTQASPEQLDEVNTLQRQLAELRQLEVDHGPGSALNLSHPSVRRLISKGHYSDREVRNAQAVSSLERPPQEND